MAGVRLSAPRLVKKQPVTSVQTLLEVGVKVFLLNPDGKYLILKRAKPYPGGKIKRWDIPGGRIIPGEELHTALQREVTEETGLTIQSILSVLTVQDILRVRGRHTIRITYLALCDKPFNVVIDPKEHETFRWVTLEELHTLRHDVYLNEVIEKLRKEEKDY